MKPTSCSAPPEQRGARPGRVVPGLVLVAALVYALFFHRLTDRDLWGSHEARAAQDAGSMLHYADWSLPRLTDERADLQKPPLYYWLVAAIARLRGGVDAWAVRLPAALAATLCVALVAWTLWWRGRPTAALCAALLLVTAQHFTWLARTARIDMPLALCVSVAVLSIGLDRRRNVLGFLAIGLGLLLKGPVGGVLPLAVILADRLIEWRLNRTPLEARVLFWGLPLALAVALPWFIGANVQTRGEFFRVFFWHHNVERALGGADDLAVHPWWYYGPRLLVDALPASLMLVPAIVLALRSRAWREDREARFGLVWLLAVVGVLSTAKFKRADYLLPAYPGLALFLGCAGERICRLAGRWPRRAVAGGLALAVAGSVAGWGYFIHVAHPRLEPQREQRSFARAVRAAAPAPAPVLFFRVECHALAFHLGRPINTLLEWENLDVWAGRPESTYVLMSPADAADWPRHLRAGTLEVVLRNADLCGGAPERPLVLLRTRPLTEIIHGASREQAADRCRTDQHGPSGTGPGGHPRPGGVRVGDRPGQARADVRNPAGG